MTRKRWYWTCLWCMFKQILFSLFNCSLVFSLNDKKNPKCKFYNWLAKSAKTGSTTRKSQKKGPRICQIFTFAEGPLIRKFFIPQICGFTSCGTYLRPPAFEYLILFRCKTALWKKADRWSKHDGHHILCMKMKCIDIDFFGPLHIVSHSVNNVIYSICIHIILATTVMILA